MFSDDAKVDRRLLSLGNQLKVPLIVGEVPRCMSVMAAKVAEIIAAQYSRAIK